jgi:hypothetical protein
MIEISNGAISAQTSRGGGMASSRRPHNADHPGGRALNMQHNSKLVATRTIIQPLPHHHISFADSKRTEMARR